MYDTCLFHSKAVFHFIDFVSKVNVETRVFISFVIYMVTL
jgi:hypothetical protein